MRSSQNESSAFQSELSLIEATVTWQKKLKIDLQRTISHGIDIASRLYSQRYINTWKIVQTTYKTRALVHLS